MNICERIELWNALHGIFPVLSPAITYKQRRRDQVPEIRSLTIKTFTEKCNADNYNLYHFINIFRSALQYFRFFWYPNILPI